MFTTVLDTGSMKGNHCHLLTRPGQRNGESYRYITIICARQIVSTGSEWKNTTTTTTKKKGTVIWILTAAEHKPY